MKTKQGTAPDEYEVYRQSKAAFKQWDKDWTKNCKLNKPYYTRKLTEIAGIGHGKPVIAVAYGSSLKNKFEQLKFLQKHFDIICVDKAFKSLVQHGIYPKYVVIADANVKYEDYGEGVDSSKSYLIINACGNHEWVKNWENKVFFYINIDNIGTQHKYSKITGVQEFIPAASNVGNATIVLCKVVLQYSQVFLLGYDFSWASHGLYYGNEQNKDKKFNMNHIKVLDINDNIVSTSTNLDFSCRWLLTYMNRFRMNAINLCEQGVLDYHIMNVPPHPYFRHGKIDKLVNLIKKQGGLQPQKKEVDVCQN